MKKITVGLAGLFAVLVTTAPMAHATLLGLSPLGAPGIAVTTNTTQSNGSNPIGTKVDDTGTLGFTLTNTAGQTGIGNYREVVYREAGGTLDFYIQAQMVSGADFVQQISTSSFAPATLLTLVGTASNVALLGTTGTQSPDFDTRSAVTGATINWTFLTNEVTAGLTSLTLVISTNATSDQAGTITLQDGGIAAVSGFEPSSVPEPAGIVLFGTASALTAFLFRRRLTRKA